MHIPLQRTLWLALGVCGLLAARTEAAPITIDFSDGTAGTLSSPTNTDTIVQVDAYYLSGSDWIQTDTSLFRRDDNSNDLGLGVCSPNEACGSGNGAGAGDYNELSNNINVEMIRLTLPGGYTWSSVGVSSADDNSGTGLLERGLLWGSNDPLPTSTDPGALFSGSPIWKIEGTSGDANQTFSAFTSANNTFAYLFFVAYDWSVSGDNDNNDYLVSTAVVDDTSGNEQSVPEPASLALLGSGLAALAAKRRRAHRR